MTFAIKTFKNQLFAALQDDSIQTVAKLVRDFANDTIQLKILLSVFGAHG